MTSFLELDIARLRGIGPAKSLLLNKMGIFQVQDLLTYFPYKYDDTTNLKSIRDFLISSDEQATVTVQVKDARNVFIRGNKSIQKLTLKDDTGELEVNFFNQPFLINSFLTNKGDTYLFNLKKSRNKQDRIVFYPKSFEKKTERQLSVGTIAPVYKLTTGISIKWLRMVQKFILDQLKENQVLKFCEDFFEDLPYPVLDLLSQVHFPQDHEQLWQSISLLSEIEVAFIYYNHNRNKKIVNKLPSFVQADLPNKIQEISNVTFTQDQLAVISQVITYYRNGDIFKLLVQGDVGSGKTYVAFFALIYNFLAGRKSAFLCPTTILAAQHFDKFKIFAKYFDIKVAKATSKSKPDKEWDVIIGTTAIYSKIKTDITLLVIDEQQKFGVFQREDYLKNDKQQDNLSIIELSATPIPRTLVSTMYGDVDLQQIKSMPFGQRRVQNYMVSQSKEEDFINWLKKQLVDGEKIIWVVPAVDSQITSNIIEEEKYLLDKLDNLKFSRLFGAMLARDKESSVEYFKTGKTQLLLSTSVVEVGIDIPDASIIVIRSPERFGLSQLHQMRGRVGRSGQESYCYLLEGDTVWDLEQKKRLEYFSSTLDGFEIAEYDLQSRGPGEIYGTRQSGIPNTKIANFSDMNSIKLGIEKGKVWLKKYYNKDINIYNMFNAGSSA